jgi:transposase
MEMATVGIDLGKTVFHLVGLNAAGETVVRKRFSRAQLLRFTANLKVGLMGMEACAGSHFLGRALREQGHEVRLMPAQYVKPYVKTNKNDYIDAEAIAEAVGLPRMRFVPIKNDEQLDMQSMHRARERWVRNRTALLNQIRGLLLERGITIRKKRSPPCRRGFARHSAGCGGELDRNDALAGGPAGIGTQAAGSSDRGDRYDDRRQG